MARHPRRTQTSTPLKCDEPTLGRKVSTGPESSTVKEILGAPSLSKTTISVADIFFGVLSLRTPKEGEGGKYRKARKEA